MNEMKNINFIAKQNQRFQRRISRNVALLVNIKLIQHYRLHRRRNDIFLNQQK